MGFIMAEIEIVVKKDGKEERRKVKFNDFLNALLRVPVLVGDPKNPRVELLGNLLFEELKIADKEH